MLGIYDESHITRWHGLEKARVLQVPVLQMGITLSMQSDASLENIVKSLIFRYIRKIKWIMHI